MFCVVILTLGQKVFAQYPYQKNSTLYFDLPGISKSVPYTQWSHKPFRLNDSLVYDIRFKKFTRKVTAISYRAREYYSDQYATPIATLKYKLNKPRVDTALVDDLVTGTLIYSINKYYEGKLLEPTSNANQSNR